MGPDFEFIHFPCRGHCSWSNRYNPDEVLWRVYTSIAICRNHCVLLHCFLSSRSDAFDDSNGYCVRNLVRCWNRINQPFGLVGQWAKTRFPGDCRHDPYLCRGSCYKYFFQILSTLVFFRESRISGAVRWFLRLKVPSANLFNWCPILAFAWPSTLSVKQARYILTE